MTETKVDENTDSRLTGSASKYAWVILLVVFIAGVAAPLNQNKVPPLMTLLMDEFSLSLSQSGMLTSFFAITGLLLAFPAGIIIQKLGAKTAGLIAVGSLVLGSTIGVFSTTMNVFLFSRVVEGLGMGLIAVVGPAVIAQWFPRDKQGVPMGVWATWAPMGGLVMYNIAPNMATTSGWQMVWWFGTAFAAVAFVLFAIFMRSPPGENIPAAVANDTDVEEPKIKDIFANRNILLLALQFSTYVFVLTSIATYLPTFLITERGYSLAQAGFVASIPTMIILVSSPLAGWVSDRIGSRKLVYTIPFAIIAVMLLFPFHLHGWQFPVFLLVLGFFGGAIPTAVFASVPEVMTNPKLIGIAMGVLITGQNLGVFAGPIIFGRIAETVSWPVAGYAMIPVCVIGVIAGWFVKVR